MTSTSTAPLLTIPQELRTQIYIQLVNNQSPTIQVSEGELPPGRKTYYQVPPKHFTATLPKNITNLQLANRQLNSEIQPFLTQHYKWPILKFIEQENQGIPSPTTRELINFLTSPLHHVFTNLIHRSVTRLSTTWLHDISRYASTTTPNRKLYEVIPSLVEIEILHPNVVQDPSVGQGTGKGMTCVDLVKSIFNVQHQGQGEIVSELPLHALGVLRGEDNICTRVRIRVIKDFQCVVGTEFLYGDDEKSMGSRSHRLTLECVVNPKTLMILEYALLRSEMVIGSGAVTGVQGVDCGCHIDGFVDMYMGSGKGV